jgi:Ca-activated chloride channel family protein
MIARKLAIELRNQYVVGYSPNNTAADGEFRHLRVDMVPPLGLPPLKAHLRAGNYAPAR